MSSFIKPSLFSTDYYFLAIPKTLVGLKMGTGAKPPNAAFQDNEISLPNKTIVSPPKADPEHQ